MKLGIAEARILDGIGFGPSFAMAARTEKPVYIREPFSIMEPSQQKTFAKGEATAGTAAPRNDSRRSRSLEFVRIIEA